MCLSLRNKFLVFMLVNFSNFLTINAKRGPHHPRSEPSDSKVKLDEHLRQDDDHIENDLQSMGLDVNFDGMSSEERNFYYFKIHDVDNNNALDGLEMLQAAMHANYHFTKDERDAFLDNATKELNHIVQVIDDFINIADLNKDGYLHYAEYVRAVNNDNIDSEIAVP